MLQRIALSLTLVFATLPLLHADGCDDDTAVQAMSRAVKADPKNANNNYNLASAYYNKQCYDQAIDAFERTLKLVKGDSDSEQSLRFEVESTLGGLYFQGRQDPGTAIKYFKQALELKPNDSFSLNGLSMALVKAGKTDEALTYLRKMLATDKSNYEAQYRYAIILNDKLEATKQPTEKQRGEVIDAFEKAAHAAEGKKGTEEMLVSSYARLGELYRDTQQSEKAVSVLNKAIQLVPDDFNSHFILGQMYYNLKNYSAMMEQYQKAVEIDPKQKLARFNLGVAYINQEQYAEAYDQFKAITDIDPGDSESLALMGQTLEKAIDQLLAQGTSDFTAENYVDAKASFEHVLALDPKNKTAGDYLAKTNVEIDKKFDEAMAKAKSSLKAHHNEDAALALEQALTLKPDDKDAQAMQGNTKANIGKLVKRYLDAGDKAFKHEDYDTAEKEWTKAKSFKQGKEKAGIKLAKLAKLTTGQLAKAMKKARAAERDKNLVSMRNAYRAALAVAPNDAEAKNGLTRVNTMISDKVKKSGDKGHKLFDQGDKKGAKTQFEAVLKLDPTNADANDYIQRLTGSQSNAKANAEKVKQLYYQGVDLYVNNKIKDAIKVWQQLLVLDPNHEDARKNIARAQAKLKALENL
jgi:tetratricopeptide (TPR) repeat protein